MLSDLRADLAHVAKISSSGRLIPLKDHNCALYDGHALTVILFDFTAIVADGLTLMNDISV